MRHSPQPQVILNIPEDREIVFATDLHLSQDNPCEVDMFCDFVSNLQAHTFVLMGDVFHIYWGPEFLNDIFWQRLLDAFQNLSKRCKTYFLWGNRDFLVGREFQLRSGIKVIGETVLLNSGQKTIYACHGDQLCRDDLLYHCMKLVIRNPAFVRLWRLLPTRLRKYFSGGIHSVTVKSLEKKKDSQLLPSRDVLKHIFSRGVDAVVSGHRHVKNIRSFNVKERECIHYELPPWTINREFLLFRKGAFSFNRYKIS